MLQLSVLCWFVKCCIFVRQLLVCYFVYACVVVCGCARVCMHACTPRHAKSILKTVPFHTQLEMILDKGEMRHAL